MNRRNEMLGNEKISKLLFKLSLPATIGMIVNALYNIVDAIFIGSWVGTDALGGLAIAFPIQMLVMAFALMIGIGAASAVSRSLGQKNIEKADYITGNAFLSIIILSSIFVIFGLSFIEPILKVFGATDKLLPYAKDYMCVIFIGTIFYTFTVASNNLVRAEGNAKIAMISMVIGTGFNIILDPIFIKLLDLGIKGAAVATIISQFCSFIFIARYLFGGNSTLKVKLHHLKPDFHILKEILTVGSASFARQVAGSIVAAVLNNLLKIYGGALEISIVGVINRITMFLYMPLFGVVQGLQPIVGFNYGANKPERVKEAVKLALKVTTIIACCGFVVSEVMAKQIMWIFNKNDIELIRNGAVVLRIVVAMLPVIGIQVVGSTVFQSLGKAGPSLILSLSRQVLFFIPLVIILPVFMGLQGIWMAYPIADISSTAITSILLNREMKKMNLSSDSDPQFKIAKECS